MYLISHCSLLFSVHLYFCQPPLSAAPFKFLQTSQIPSSRSLLFSIFFFIIYSFHSPAVSLLGVLTFLSLLCEFIYCIFVSLRLLISLVQSLFSCMLFSSLTHLLHYSVFVLLFSSSLHDLTPFFIFLTFLSIILHFYFFRSSL